MPQPAKGLAGSAERFDAFPEVAVIQRRASRVQAWRTAGRAVVKTLVFVGVLYALFTWVFGLAVVRGSSMEPTAGDGDLALVFRNPDALVANDVVVYRDGSGSQLMGRIAAVPGEEVEITADGTVEVNGNAQPSVTGEKTVAGSAANPLQLGAGEYYVLADKRAQATDSRKLGAIGINEVEGTVIALLRLRGI